VREVEDLPDIPTDDTGHPDAVLSVIGELAAFDHWRQHVTLIENVIVPAGATTADLDRLYDEALDRLDQLAADGSSPLDEPLVEPPVGDEDLPDVTSSMGPDNYRRAVEVAKEHILAGDIFQVVLAQRFDLQLDADPFDYYRVLRQVNPSPYMYFVRLPELTLVGCSPEPMVQLLDGRVISRPIAGTRRRGRTDEEDRRLGAELSEHPKELAEHVMLVDLARNDLGRVAVPGSIVVHPSRSIERYSHVMHMVSGVRGIIAPGRDAFDLFAAAFPAGTVTGAPKVRAMELIDAIEPSGRGFYAGCVGYFGHGGVMDQALAIRTLVFSEGRGTFQAGAGIVADSDPEREYDEVLAKAAALRAALAAASTP
jgi:anthranilate synthase component 1